MKNCYQSEEPVPSIVGVDSFANDSEKNLPPVGCFSCKIMACFKRKRDILPIQSDMKFENGSKTKRKSDCALENLLADPVLVIALKRFLHNELGENQLLFYLDAREFESKSNCSVEELQDSAQKIYNQFFSSLFNGIVIDEATRSQIKKDLMIESVVNSEGNFVQKVLQTNADILQQAFSVAGLKVFQDIKVTYLPIFMTSNSFLRLRDPKGFYQELREIPSDASKFLPQMSMRQILEHPVAVYYLMDYATQHQLLEGKAADLLTLQMETSHYMNESIRSVRQDRLKRILSRYNKVNLNSIKQLSERVESDPEIFRQVDPTIVKNIQDEVLAQFASIEKEFKKSDYFTKLVDEGKSTENERLEAAGTSQLQETISNLSKYSAERNLVKLDDELTINEILQNPQGLCYLKKFAIENLMEDSIFFYIAVENFKKKARDMGTSADATFLREIGQNVAKKYLLNTSPMLINISENLRTRTVSNLINQPSQGVFNVVQNEVVQLIRSNLYQAFQQTPAYGYLKLRIREKKIIKTMQGHMTKLDKIEKESDPKSD